MAMNVTNVRGLYRYVALFAVVLLIYWTTWVSDTGYKFKAQFSSYSSHDSNTEVASTEPVTGDVDAVAQEKGDVLSSEQIATTTSSSATEIITDISSAEDGGYTHEYLHKSRSKSRVKTRVKTRLPSTKLIDHVPSTTTTTIMTTTTTTTASPTQYDPEDFLDESEENKYAYDEGTADQQKQSEDISDIQSKPEGQNITYVQIEQYVQSILNLNVTTVDRLSCPGEMLERPRYEVLRKNAKSRQGIQYLFAMDLYQSVEIMPRLIGTVVQVAKFLGPENCGVSIVEGRSTDGTYNVLDELKHHFQQLGLQYWLQTSDLNPKESDMDRIEALARLRNMAFDPIVSETDLFSDKPVLIFINDIVPCPDDVYEMIYQHELQGAVQTCAMDWIEQGENFYDVWVSRSMTGDTFWEIPQDGSWVFVRNLFFDDPFTRDKWLRHEPFQVFSCWGGMTAIDGTPFIYDSLRIRRNYEGECYGGEPQLLGSDLAKLGISRVQTLPQVNVGYTNREGLQVKTVRKYVHELVDVDELIESFDNDDSTVRIKWKPPPARIRCMPSFNDHWWVDAWYDPDKED